MGDKALQWPDEFASLAEAIIEKWTVQFGNMRELHVELYGPGGRLHGVAQPHDISRRVWSMHLAKIVYMLM